MFSKVKDKKKKETLIALHTFIVEGTQGAAGQALVPLAMANELMKQEPTFVTVLNPAPDVAGNVAVKATDAGIAGSGAPPAAPKPAANPSQFEIELGIVCPEPKRGGGLKGETYPFMSLPVGGSIFIPATEENPNPAKGMASTVTSANKRFVATYPATTGRDKKPHPKAGQPTGKDGRKFTVRARTAEDKDPKGVGARVWRIA